MGNGKEGVETGRVWVEAGREGGGNWEISGWREWVGNGRVDV